MHEPNFISAGLMFIDPDRRLVEWRGVEVKGLQRRQFDILFVLVKHAGFVVTQENFLAAIWPEDADILHNSVTALVCKVIQKLRRVGCHNITTIHHLGFRYDAELENGKRIIRHLHVSSNKQTDHDIDEGECIKVAARKIVTDRKAKAGKLPGLLASKPPRLNPPPKQKRPKKAQFTLQESQASLSAEIEKRTDVKIMGIKAGAFRVHPNEFKQMKQALAMRKDRAEIARRAAENAK